MLISIGEVVWDIFNGNRVLGGAPVNVAYHLGALDMAVKVVSRVGTDELGRLALEKIAALGLPVNGIQKDDKLPTGRVKVTIDQEGEPRFDIESPAAWDRIDGQTAKQLTRAAPAFHLIFGTLAQRSAVSRAAIRGLWDQADLRFYDVNLRPPFTTRELVLDSLAAADVVKLNRAELATITGWLGLVSGDEIQRGRKLLRAYSLTALAVSAGKAGAWLVSREEEVFSHPGFPVEVHDTVGAGDAFFATLIEGFLLKRPWPECLARANRRGAYVAARPGATPPMELGQ